MSREMKGRPDFLLLFLAVFLVGFGLVMIFSTSSPMALLKHADPWYYVYRQGMFAVIGLVLMLIFMNIPFSVWAKWSPFLMLSSLFMLVLVLFVGNDVGGARRWFTIGGFNFQPAEFVKLSIIIYVSAMISKKGERIRQFSKGLVPILVMVVLILLLILKQPDFGTVLILLFIAGVIIVVGGADLRHLLMLGLVSIPAVIYMAFGKSYRLKRISSFLNPTGDLADSGYQLSQSLFALGHGGLTGTGLGKSVQKLFYLPAAHTDFIFSVIGEEFGFVGSASLVIVFFLFLWRGFTAAIRSDEPFGIMLGIGIVAMLSIQLLLNIGAVTGSLPITGVTLPFISYGGSSLILCMASTGILLSISRDNNRRYLLNAKV